MAWPAKPRSSGRRPNLAETGLPTAGGEVIDIETDTTACETAKAAEGVPAMNEGWEAPS